MPEEAARVPPSRTHGLVVLGMCFAAAALSLLLPFAESSDEWSWLIWGRQVRELDLQLAGGTAWKPLPVLFTTAVSALGDAAPQVWLVLARGAGLSAFVAACRVGTRLDSRAAGIIGAAALLLFSPGAEWLGRLLPGASEPLIVALVLWGIDRHLHGHRLQALGLGCLAALGRPEPWPLVIVYAALIWRSQSWPRRALITSAVASVPALWLGGGLWGAGDPLAAVHNAQSAVAHKSAGPRSAREVHLLGFLAFGLVRTAAVVILPMWVGATVAWGRAVHMLRQGNGNEGARVTVALGIGIAGWFLIVLAGGFVGLPVVPRFVGAPAAVVSVLAGVGAAQLVRSAKGRGARLFVALAMTIAAAPFVITRVAKLVAHVDPQTYQFKTEPGLAEALATSDAKRRLRACDDKVLVRNVKPRTRRIETAWRLGIPIADVRRLRGSELTTVRQALVIVGNGDPSVPPAGRTAYRRAQAAAPGRWRRVALAGKWAVYEVGCRPSERNLAAISDGDKHH